MQGKTLAELAEHTSGRIVGDSDTIITGVSTLEEAGAGEITFLSNEKYIPQLLTTKAAAVIVSKEVKTKAAMLIAEDPYYALMRIVVLMYGHRKHPEVVISERAAIADSAKIGIGTQVSDFVTIGENVSVGRDCYFYPGVFIGPDVTIGDGCVFYANAVIYDNTSIGNRVIVQANASIAQDGFGFATHEGVHHKIPQIGKVILEDDVEIGACAVIERATLKNTVIGAGTKIGDQVAIGHGTKVGPHCLLVPKVGISGSTTIGHHCVFGGQVGVVGHIKIGNMVKVGAQAGVINDVPDGTTLLGSPAIEASRAKRALTLIGHLPEMKKRIRRLEKAMDARDKSKEQAK